MKFIKIFEVKNLKFISFILIICLSILKYIRFEFEKQIKLTKASFLDKSFDIYVYNDQDYISNSIRFGQSWESTETKQIINAIFKFGFKQKFFFKI